MKFYVHFEGTPDFTLLLDWGEDKQALSFQELKQSFVETYNKRFTQNLVADNFILASERNKKFSPQASVLKEIRRGEDIFLRNASSDSTKSTNVTTKPIKSTTNNNNNNNTTKVEQKNEDVSQLIRLLQNTIAQAQENVKKGQFRSALLLYEQILEHVPTEMSCLHHIGEIYAHAEKYDKALKYFLLGAQHHPSQIEFAISAGECYFSKKEYNLAYEQFSRALKLIEKDTKGELKNLHHERLQVLLGKTLYRMGKQDIGGQLIQKVVHANESNPDALMEFGKILSEQNRKEDAMRVFLKLIVIKSDYPEARAQLTRTIEGVKNCEELIASELGGSASLTAPALAFLAQIIKEHGAVKEAASLYGKAWRLDITNANMCLTYVHTVEVLNDYNTAFQAIIEYCRANSKKKVGSYLTCQHILSIIEGIKNVTDIHALNEHATRVKVVEIPPLEDTVSLSNEELDLLALYFTLVKILYVCGGLTLLPFITSLLDPIKGKRELHLTPIRNEQAYYACITQLVDIHKSQEGKSPLELLATLNLNNNNNNTKILYVAGDSHSLAPAWQTIQWKGESWLLKPMLVTGLKAWHLRPESDFFPKRNYESVIQSIPKNSQVLYLFGEIDCREGLLVAVEKVKYDNLEEAVTATVDIYIQAMLKQVKERQFTIYVHPVVPVLNETRSTVKLFNRILEERIISKNAPALKWLNFFDKLLNEEGGFNSEYNLDNTHLNPKYITLLEQAMQIY